MSTTLMQRRSTGAPRLNLADLVVLTVAGQIVHPASKSSPYRIGRDGVPRVLPGTGGVVINQRVGDRCIGLAADHVEPGVSLKNLQVGRGRDKDASNLALNTYACVGNRAVVLSGPCAGSKGVVTGKHGGVNHVLVDFPPAVLRRLQIGDRLQIYAQGLGLQLLDHPPIAVCNCAPLLLRRWGLRSRPGRLFVPVSHAVPAALMGSGLGRNNAVRGDYDIQLPAPAMARRLRLDTLRFGDLLAILDADTRYGRRYRPGHITIGIVVHGDSTVSGHGPGVVTLLSGPARCLEPVHDEQANLAVVLGLRELPPPRRYQSLLARHPARSGLAGRQPIWS